MGVQRWWFQWPLRLRALLRGGQVEQELDEELRFHLDHLVEDGLAAGLSRKAARDAALKTMGGVTQQKEEMRDMQGLRWLTDLREDVRYAIRSLRRAPGLTGFVVLALALGIGLSAASFSMLDALVFRPYPVPRPGQVVSLVSTSREHGYEAFSYREYLDLRDRTRSYDGVVAGSALVAASFGADSRATPKVKACQLVSGNFFRVLGVEPTLGRGFRADEDLVPGRDPVVVLGYELWQREYAGDRSVVGRTVRLNGKDCTVIGVAPESFPGLLIFTHTDFYVPLAMQKLFATDSEQNVFETRDARWLNVKARLRPGVPLAKARSEIAVLAQDFAREYPQSSRNRGAAVRTFHEMRTQADDINWKFGAVFTGLALAVLLVACINVAGLLLSRASTRTREIAVRLALGAGRSRLIRMLLTESLLLALLGGLGGVGVGFAGIGFLQRFSIPATLPVTIPFRMDLRVLLACFALASVSALLCGLAPALQSANADLVSGLKSSEADTSGPKRLWGRNLLVVAQVAISLMLLTAAFLMVRGFEHGAIGGSGFPREHLLIARFDPGLMQYDSTRTEQFYARLLEGVRELPGVRSATLTQNPPLGLEAFESLTFVPEGFAMPRDRESFTSLTDTVDPGYFGTLGIPIVRGRDLRASDDAKSPRVAVVNEQFAKHYWPGAEAVGRHVRIGHRGGVSVEIVGVARTIKYKSTTERPLDFVYRPLAQRPTAQLALMLRTTNEPLQTVAPLKALVRTLDPNLPVVEMRTFDDLYRYNAVEGPGVAIRMVGTMGGVALLLAIAGLYGLIAYNVNRRTHEIGIRMALGATPRDVLRLVMGKSLTLVAAGTAIGLALGFLVERLMNSMLFEGSGVDVGVYLIVVPAMLLVTMLAAYIPARRAAQIEPTRALRCD